jgi:glycosyltransferase involved in cell wall biosynthesis
VNVALVVPRFEAPASSVSRRVEERLAAALRDRSDGVTVLTTDVPESKRDGIAVIPFKTDPHDERRLRALEWRLNDGDRTAAQRSAGLSEVELDALIANRSNSTQLLTYLARHVDDFDVIVFFGYETGLALRGWRIASSRTAVVAKLEMDAGAHLPPVTAMMLGAARVLFATDAEAAAARSLYGPAISATGRVIGSLEDGTSESVDRLRNEFAEIAARRGPSPRRAARRVFHHLRRARYADSETVLALQLDELLRGSGYRSRVVSDDRDPRLGAQVGDSSEVDADDSTSLAYGDLVAEEASRAGWAGKIVIGDALPTITAADGSSATVPPFLDIESWSVEPLRDEIVALSDGRTNLLCVGDVHPRNRVLELVEIFHHYVAMDFDSRLILAGPLLDEAYTERVRRHVDRRGLEGRVRLTGTVSRPALAAMYRTASVFVSVRDRYETGLSLLEAMAFDVPICVRDTVSANAVAAGKSILFSELSSAFQVAALWRVVVTDDPLRDAIVTSQRSRLALLTPERTRRALEDAMGFSSDLLRA